VEVQWDGDQRFEAKGRAEVTIPVDGRSTAAPSPMEDLLIGLASCMGIDVVAILEKMRVPLRSLAVRVEGDRRRDPPRYFTAIRIEYRVGGVAGTDRDKLQRAVDLSRDTYCSVLHSLRSDIEVSIQIDTD
jgi:putative redox protein